MEEQRKRCVDCSHWEPGEFWSATGTKGWCLAKPNKRKRWNYCNACDLFDERKKTGFFYQGGGGNSIEVDLDNIADKMEELAKSNSQISVPRWFLASLENTLRIQHNINLSRPDCCQSRNVKGALNGVRKLLKGEELTGMERLESLVQL